MNVEFWANFSKRRISLARPGAAGTTKTCVLKDDTSITTPTIILSGHTYFSYNYAYISDFGRYYYVNEIKTIGPNSEISLVCDVLATYKDIILASTQYVCYSSHNTSVWLPDSRVPILNSSDVNEAQVSLAGAFSSAGFYVLTVVGPNGNVFLVRNKGDLDTLVDEVSNWKTTTIDSALNGSAGGVSYNWGTTEDCLESLSKMLTQSDIMGNAYSNAPQMIRSCKWVPFSASDFAVGYGKTIYLGEFQTSVTTEYCNIYPVWRRFDVSIPWHYNDWRRSSCESVYLYLPFVGNVNLAVDELVSFDSIEVDLTLSAVDGTMQYCVKVGNTVLGLYSANCSADYQIGINQKASAGDVFQTIMQGVDKLTSIGVNASIDPVTDLAVSGSMLLEGAITGYNIMNVQKSTHPTVIGSISGAVNSKSPTSLTCTVIAHPSAISPSDMAATMGLPTMKPMSLSNLTGFCQCANAHLAMNGTADEKNAVDTFLNSGIYIE